MAHLIVKKEDSFYKIPVLENQSILSALENAGIKAESQCRDGFCGTCSIKVLGDSDNVFLLDGKDDIGLTKQGEVLICVSGVCPSKRVSIDLDKIGS